MLTKGKVRGAGVVRPKRVEGEWLASYSRGSVLLELFLEDSYRSVCISQMFIQLFSIVGGYQCLGGTHHLHLQG